MAELLRDAAPEKVSLDAVDISRDRERATTDGVDQTRGSSFPEAAGPFGHRRLP